MKVVAIIPIKLNNERLPGKNTKLLGNRPLVWYALNALRESHCIDKTFVYCSSPDIIPYIGDTADFLQRPKELDGPHSNFTQIFESFSNRIDSDIYVYAHATAPFVISASIATCVNAVRSGKYDSAFTATVIQDFLWQDGQPLNFDATNLPRSQDLKPIYCETSGIYVFTKDVFQKFHRRIGINPYIHTVSFFEAVDINTAEDFHIAEVLLKGGTIK